MRAVTPSRFVEVHTCVYDMAGQDNLKTRQNGAEGSTMPWLIAALTIGFCVSAQAQENCYETVRSVSTLTFAEIECREDFGASKVAQSIQSCASILSETEFDRITRAADDAFRSRVLKEGLPSVCAEAHHSISK